MFLRGLLAVPLFVLSLGQLQSAAAGQYRPMANWVDPQLESLARWEGHLQGAVELSKPGAAPTVGVLRSRPQGVTLLEDYMLRRHPRLLNYSPAKARALIDRQYTRRLGPLRGYTAEAVFVDRNPEWKIVESGNASQHDVTRFVPGRKTPFNGQIKYHDSGTPSVYARDMVKDYRAHRVFIPDDHVGPTKAYLRAEAEKLQARGDVAGAKRVWRDYGRTRGIGATSKEIRGLTDDAGRYVAAERRVMAANWRTAAVRLESQPLASASSAGTATGMRRGLRSSSYRVGGGRYVAARAFRPPNVVVGGVSAVVLTALFLYEHGWRNGFSRPEFYEDAFGNISAIGISCVVGKYVTGLTAGTGPWAPVIGASIGMLTGAVVYVGGREIAHSIIALLAPEMLLQWERGKREVAGWVVDRSIEELQRL